VSDGKVVHAATKLSQGYSGYGRVVVIQASDDGPWFLYAHLDQVGVGAGSVVSVGQQIGTVGRTCYSRDDPTRLCAGGAHLHFEASPRPYPQGAEAPRLDPARFVGTDGGFLRPLAFGAGAGAVLALAAAAGVWWLAKGRDA
jgi:murein DD-endopeptidase MepM/ murein hydrolase activator NlpD